MELLSKDITLGFYNDTGVINLPVSQYDTGRIISIGFTNDGKRFAIPENTSVFLKALKPDGKQINTDEWCRIQENRVNIELSKQLTAVPGTVKCELILSDSTGKQYTSSRFHIVVGKSVHNDENLLSTDTYKNIIDLLLDLDALKKDLIFKKEKDQPDGVPSLDEHAKIPRHELYEANLEQSGVVRLVDSTESSSITDAATPNSVKMVRDALASHTSHTENPHAVTKAQVGLGNADNTADKDKPVSTAQREAIDASLLEAKAYTDVHTENGDIHVSTADKNLWNQTTESLYGEITRATEKETEIADSLAKEVARLDEITSRVTYGICSTDAETAAKTVACAGFRFVEGAEITVKFTVTNIAAEPTLNVNDTGERPIYYKGSPIFARYLSADGTYTFRYNGAQYELVGDISAETGSGAVSVEEIGILENLQTEDRTNLVAAINSLTLSCDEMIQATRDWTENLLESHFHELDPDSLLRKTGDAGKTTVSFTPASSRSLPVSDENMEVILGKVNTYLADLKNVAFSGSYSDLSGRPSIISSYTSLSCKPISQFSLRSAAVSGVAKYEITRLFSGSRSYLLSSTSHAATSDSTNLVYKFSDTTLEDSYPHARSSSGYSSSSDISAYPINKNWINYAILIIGTGGAATASAQSANDYSAARLLVGKANSYANNNTSNWNGYTVHNCSLGSNGGKTARWSIAVTAGTTSVKPAVYIQIPKGSWAMVSCFLLPLGAGVPSIPTFDSTGTSSYGRGTIYSCRGVETKSYC